MRATLERLVVAAVFAVLLPACSTVKLAYNNADEVIAWMTDDYLALNREQEDGLRVLLVRFHTWHRSTQLPEYARLLDSANRRLATGLTEADVAWAADAIEDRYRILALRAHADAARVLATLSDEQVAHLRRKLEDSNRKWAEANGAEASAEEQKRMRARRLLERIEHWTGTLSGAQTVRLTEWIDALPLITDQSMAFRLRRQRDFLSLLATRHDAEALSTRLRAWLLARDRTHAPEYGPDYARFVAGRARLYVEGFRLLSAEQRQHVANRLQRYSQAFRELAEETPRPSSLAALLETPDANPSSARGRAGRCHGPGLHCGTWQEHAFGSL
jgi:hypothetical protein